MAKKKNIDMGSRRFTYADHNAYLWCIRNRILISPLAKSNVRWYIEITINGKITKDPNDYGKTEIWDKIFEYYKYYYKKRKQ